MRPGTGNFAGARRGSPRLCPARRSATADEWSACGPHAGGERVREIKAGVITTSPAGVGALPSLMNGITQRGPRGRGRNPHPLWARVSPRVRRHRAHHHACSLAGYVRSPDRSPASPDAFGRERTARALPPPTLLSAPPASRVTEETSAPQESAGNSKPEPPPRPRRPEHVAHYARTHRHERIVNPPPEAAGNAG